MTGFLLDASLNGLYIEMTDSGYGVKYRRVKEGVHATEFNVVSVRDVFDERQGNYVSGFEIHDARGYPTGEVYKLSDFTMSGNIAGGSPTAIRY